MEVSQVRLPIDAWDYRLLIPGVTIVEIGTESKVDRLLVLDHECRNGELILTLGKGARNEPR
jgi:hypothetical protein